MTKNVPQVEKFGEVTVELRSGSMLRIEGTVPVSALLACEKRVMREFVREYELPGFRRGHVPEETVRAQVGERKILEESADRALSEAYAAIVHARDLPVVGRPKITVTSLAHDEPVGFVIEVAKYPEVTLPAYAEIARKGVANHEDPETVDVTEEEVIAEAKRLQRIVSGQEVEESGEAPKEELPEPDDAFARSLGDFDDLADLKEKIAKGLRLDKREKSREKRRLGIISAILENTSFEVPSILTDSELEHMVSTFRERLARAGIGEREYLETVGKSIEDLRTEWRPDAEKRAKVQVILTEIANKEKILPEEGGVLREVVHLREHHPDVEPEVLYRYVSLQRTNELVLAFLERGAQNA